MYELNGVGWVLVMIVSFVRMNGLWIWSLVRTEGFDGLSGTSRSSNQIKVLMDAEWSSREIRRYFKEKSFKKRKRFQNPRLLHTTKELGQALLSSAKLRIFKSRRFLMRKNLTWNFQIASNSTVSPISFQRTMEFQAVQERQTEAGYIRMLERASLFTYSTRLFRTVIRIYFRYGLKRLTSYLIPAVSTIFCY